MAKPNISKLTEVAPIQARIACIAVIGIFAAVGAFNICVNHVVSQANAEQISKLSNQYQNMLGEVNKAAWFHQDIGKVHKLIEDCQNRADKEGGACYITYENNTVTASYLGAGAATPEDVVEDIQQGQ